tara:strand:+ start:140 stop:373 length:234 start_codon:yes stop_codon:yes gene_type:complete
MPTKLFGASWMRQTRTAINILDDANIGYQFIDVHAEPTIALALEGAIGPYTLPVLFVDGREYKGVEKVREYIKSTTK